MKKIVLIENNLIFSQKIAANLKGLGYAVQVEQSFDSVRVEAETGISAIIVDLAARGMDGLGMVKNIKSAPETAAIPVIGFCGHAEKELMEKATANGCEIVTTNGKITSDLPALLNKIKLRD